MATTYDDYGLELSGIDPESSTELRKLKREQEIADLMMQRGLQAPQGQMVSGIYVRPSITQNMAQLANAYFSGQKQKEVDAGYQGIADRQKSAEDARLKQMIDTMTGRPEVPATYAPSMAFKPNEDGSLKQVEQSPAQPAIPGNPQKAVTDYLMSRSPTAGAMLMAQQLQADKAREDAQAQRMLELKMRLDDNRLSREDRNALQRELAQMRIDSARELKSMVGAMGRSQPYFSPFDSAQGAMVFDHRTGKMAPAMVDGKPLVKAASDPALQGAIAGAKEAGQAQAKRAINMAGLGDTIKEAEDLLSGASGKALPTGSSLGAAVDWAGGLVGMNPEGATEAQTLKAIGGALTSKMPRMEGPQSDKDTQLYREMAAVVGDSTVPRERRLAALGKVKELWGKYEKQQPTSTAPEGGKYSGMTDAQIKAALGLQ